MKQKLAGGFFFYGTQIYNPSSSGNVVGEIGPSHRIDRKKMKPPH